MELQVSFTKLCARKDDVVKVGSSRAGNGDQTVGVEI
jgi:hypothetical protein